MGFSDKTSVVGRQTANLLDLDLDGCSLTYGESPCTATLGRTNYFIRSDEMDDAAWAKTNLSITADQDVHPIIGGTIVDQCLETAVNAEHRVQGVYAGLDVTLTFTASFVVKGIGTGRTQFQLRVWNDSDITNSFLIEFDTANQTVDNFIDFGAAVFEKSSITPLGNGYFRLTISGVTDPLGGATDGVRASCYIMEAGSTAYLGDITKGAFICAAQLREGSDPGLYAQTGAAIVDGMGTVDDLCFNTFETCQDTANYNKETRTYKFMDNIVRPPSFISHYPAIRSVRYSSTQLKPGGKFSTRGSVVITLQDFADNDANVDDYQVERSYDPELQGTFFGKLKTRNPFYIGRSMTVREGYLDDADNPPEGSDPNFPDLSLYVPLNGDFTSYGNAAVNWSLVGSATFDLLNTPPIIGGGLGSLRTQGTNDWAETPFDSAYNFGDGEFTIRGWVRPFSDPSSANGDICSLWENGLGNRSYYAAMVSGGANGNLRFLYYDGIGDNSINYPIDTATAAATWYHVVICRDKSDGLDVLRMFWNGDRIEDSGNQLHDFAGKTINPADSGRVFKIGDRGSGGDDLNGWVGELQVYKTCLDEYRTDANIAVPAIPASIVDGSLTANFRNREYILENITGPTADGRVTITGKDILALARDDRSKAPVASTYTLRAAMTSGQTTLLPQIGEAVLMVAGDKHVRINDEIILLGAESPTDTINVTRAQGGTIAAAHAIGDAVQECLTFEDEPVIDVLDTLLTTFANIPSAFIPTADWEAEETESLSGYDLETIITQPTGVTKLIQEICEITLIDIWYSDVDQEIKLKLQTPFTTVTELWDDDNEVVADTLKTKDVSEQRLSRVLIYYGMRNFAEKLNEPENFRLANFEIEVDKEGVNKYNDERIRTIFSRWFDGTNSTQVALTSQRLLARFGITPIEVSFDIDAKDVETLQVGDVYDLQTRVIQGFDGLPRTVRFQVTESKPKIIGHSYTYKSLGFFQDPTPDTLTISANVTCYDLFVELGGPPGPVDVTLTINAAVTVDGVNGCAAIVTTGMHPNSTLRIVNNGDIRGYGGSGGGGKDATAFSEFEAACEFFNLKTGGSGGGSGGDAIDTTIDLTIDNTSGNIWAGAGGGGGGDSYVLNQTAQGGGGGGGGLGTDTGNGGPGGDGDASGVTCGGPGSEGDGLVGASGSIGAAGAGGLKGGANAGDGGAGGADWGDDGLIGGSGGIAGGPGGFAVRLNGNMITWEGGNTAARVKGDVA